VKKQHGNSKFTAEIRSRIFHAISLGATKELAAKFAGISEATLYMWLAHGRQGKKEYAVFLEIYQRTEAQAALNALTIINSHAVNKWQAAAWLLERRWQGYQNSRPPIEEIGFEDDCIDTATMIEEIKNSKELLKRITGPVIDLDE